MVVGGSFYGNHLLFERLYKSVQEQVDQLAEKIMGYLGGEAVALTPQLQLMVEATRRWEQVASCLHLRGLASESDLQHSIKTAYDGIKAAGSMTLGLDDWLMATANAHEENTYLLQQVKAQPPSDKEASGAPSAEGDFYKAPNQREVLEFARSNAISNSVEVTEEAVKEDHLDIPEAKAVAEAEEAPLLPTQIAEEPGGKAVSTLNRYVLFSEDPVAEKAVSMNKKRMAAWCGEVSDAP
jgi:DNA-binding ferritin-like protein